MRTILLILFFLCYTTLKGADPDTLSLQKCLTVAAERSPSARQQEISAEMLKNKMKNISTNWYPAAGINAQASYNSETVDFSGVIPGSPLNIPSLPLDQYKIWAEINQPIYDGGTSKALRRIEDAGYRADFYQTESEVLMLRLQVSQVFFSLLQTRNNSEIIALSLGQLAARKIAVKAGVDNGAILQENLLAIDAEEISLQQKVTELRLLSDQLFKVLCILTDSGFPVNSVIAEPDVPPAEQEGVRPEFLLFDQQKEKLEANKKLVTSADMPRIFAFSQLAYGRPGYNLMSRDFHTFYTLGAGMKWNFLNYGDSKRQKKILELQQDVINVRRDNFDSQLQIQLQTEKTNMIRYDSLMVQDEKILKIRKMITESGFSRLTHGVITSADYLEDMNAELIARLQLENHRILRKQAGINFLMIQGKLKY